MNYSIQPQVLKMIHEGLLEGTREAIVAVSPEGRIIEANRVAEETFGYIINTHASYLFQKKDWGYIEYTLKYNNRDRCDFKALLKTKSNLRNYLLNIRKIHNRLSDDTIYIFIMHKEEDYSDNNLETLKKLFSSSIHEVKNFLCIIQTDERVPAEYKEKLASLIQKISNTISQNDLIKLCYSYIKINLFMKNIVLIFSERVSNITIEESYDERLNDVYNMTDAEKIETVIMNLFINSINATAKKKIYSGDSGYEAKIKVRTELTAPPEIIDKRGNKIYTQHHNEYILIQITDNGTPIDAPERIFEFGYSETEGGNGVGLYTVVHYVKALGGYITVENFFSNGNPLSYTKSFNIYLPFLQKKTPSEEEGE